MEFVKIHERRNQWSCGMKRGITRARRRRRRRRRGGGMGRMSPFSSDYGICETSQAPKWSEVRKRVLVRFEI